MKQSLYSIVRYTDHLLKHASVPDWAEAKNGLQVENGGSVSTIAAAVDAHEMSIRQAVEVGATLLIVHHGLFWNGAETVTGPVYRRLKLALDNNLAIYSSHLPLDLHPTLGNNALLAKALGFGKTKPFFTEHGASIGFKARIRISRNDLACRLEKVLGSKIQMIKGGPKQVRSVGIVSGGAGSARDLRTAAGEGVDTYITGQGDHSAFGVAHEMGLNVMYGGHYATEIFGVKALGAHLAHRFKLPWTFIDIPSGL